MKNNTTIRSFLLYAGNYTLISMRYIVITTLLLQFSTTFARQITSNQSLLLAQKFYQEHHTANSSKIKSTSTTTFQLDYVCTDKSQATKVKALTDSITPYFYVYNISNNQGFIIVSGDDATKPILAYSDETTFPATNIPANLQYWLDYYKSEIKFAQSSALNISLLDTTTLSKSNSSVSSVVVQPLLGSIQWDQSAPYNLFCPYITAESTRAVTGCVATAMAQVMRYYQWPLKGTGSYSYTDGNNGTLTADFSNTTYDWSNMLESYTSGSISKQDSAVATLMYHCGVAVSMTYSTTGSSATLSDAATALKNYFGYDTDLNIYTRDFYKSSDWMSMIKTELDNARPVLYGGSTGTAGHAFVCDGYDSNNLFHINWGWSGYYNGYFELSILNPPPTGSTTTTGGFSQGQQIITGIKKDDAVSNPSYLINMYSLGLTSTKSTISNIASQTFNVNFGFLNYGANDFVGKFGIGLYKDGVFQKTLATYPNNVSIISNYGTPSFTLSALSLAGLSAGSYKIYCIYKASTASSWSIMSPTNTLNNYLNVVVTGTTATISKPSLAPILNLTQKVTLQGKAYNNRTANFNVTVTNTGNEFYSNMGIKIYSTTNSNVYQYIEYGVVNIPAGETKSFTFSGTITCAAGSYYAAAVCDSTNAFSANSFKVITPISYNPISITVLSEPGASVLSLSSPITLPNGSTTVYRNQDITLNANITNTGGYFDSEVIAFVLKADGSSSVGYLTPKTIYIDTNETQTISLSGSLSLEPGSYFFKLYYQNTSWIGFTPAASALLNFTLMNAVTTDNTNSTEYSCQISPNPVVDAFSIKNIEGKAKLVISDINGRLLITKDIFCDEQISVNNLSKGVYILSITTQNKTVERKMIKN